MDNLTTMTLTDELATKQDEIISGQESLNLSKIYDEINSLGILAKPIQDYFEMTQDEYYNSESDGKLNLLQLNEKLGSLSDRILTNHVDGYVDKDEINFTYNHENPTTDGIYDRKTDFNVLLYSLKVIGAVRAIAPNELKKALSKDAVLSLGLAAHALANN
ncbi:hypothetical protein [Lactobacillus sp. PV012]|uniref:hypothetical protein n=1 Tax=Lactobacillus sp. PV012 TaxID=2594494 RepID=UPI00223EE565|nr:hypothetical protein [Lactobacillus sp. PV012]QNQ81730.1 hypothetical protein FP433_01010 [Lactobacillus sp. PV012]